MISIYRVDEHGGIQAEFPDAEALHQLLAKALRRTAVACVSLAPYGDTTFNCLQLPVRAAELRAAGVKQAESYVSASKLSPDLSRP